MGLLVFVFSGKRGKDWGRWESKNGGKVVSAGRRASVVSFGERKCFLGAYVRVFAHIIEEQELN